MSRLVISPGVKLFELTVGSALASAVSTALVEYGVTLRHARASLPGDRSWLLALLIALYGAVALLLGVIEGVIASSLVNVGAVGAGRALIGRLAEDERFDRGAAATLMAASVAVAAFAFWVAVLSFEMVAHSQRQLVAAILCGAISACSLPLFILLALPVRQALLPLSRLLPRWRRLPAAFVLAIAGIAPVVIGGAAFVESSLDWRGMHLGPFIVGTLFFVLQGTWVLLLRGPLARVQRLSRARRPLVVAATAAALVLPAGMLRGEPRSGAMVMLFQASYGGGSLVALVQRLSDRDHDGFSTVLGGGDCDDHDPAVHPGAHDVPDDGVDQNCLGGDAHAAVSRPPAARVPGGFSFRGNVLFIYIDTLRADRVTAERMPTLTALGQRGARFLRAYAQAPGTSRSYPSFVTSRLPSQVVWDDAYQEYPGMLQNHTVVEALREAGYHTVALTSHYYFNVPGLAQGYDEFDNGGALPLIEAWHDVSAPRVVARVERTLPRLVADGRPFAMLVHFIEPHAAYEPHPEVRHGGPAPRTAEGRYDEECTYLDGQLARLLRLLDDNHLTDRTIVVVFSDHGEAFGAHREEGLNVIYHGWTLHDEALRVPLIIAAPGLSPRLVDQPVMLLDVAPTVLDVLGVARPAAFQGRSLAGALAGLPLEPAPVYAELLPRPAWKFDARAILDADGRTKIIYDITRPRFEVYDTVNDPLELHDTSQSEPEVTERMRGQMAAWLDSAP